MSRFPLVLLCRASLLLIMAFTWVSSSPAVTRSDKLSASSKSGLAIQGYDNTNNRDLLSINLQGQHEIVTVNSIERRTQHITTEANGCNCTNYKCSCCVHLDIPKIHLDDTGCVDVSYLPKELGFELSLLLNGRILFDEKISARNPPPICVGVPHLHKYASICIDIYNVTWSQKYGACLKLEAKLVGITIEDVNLGCFYFNTKRLDKLENALRSLYKVKMQKSVKVLENFINEDVLF